MGMNVALIKSGKVVNVIQANTLSWAGYIAIESNTAKIGDGYANGVFTPKTEIYTESAVSNNTPAAPVIPTEVSNIQAFAAIKYFGLLPTIQEYMSTLEPDDLTRVTWEKATTFKRSSPTLQGIASELGLSSAALDDLFVYAASVTV